MIWQALGDYRGPARADAFACYACELCRQRAERNTFRNYLADSAHLHGQGKYMGTRMHDLLHPKHDDEVDAEQVISHVVELAGLEVVE